MIIKHLFTRCKTSCSARFSEYSFWEQIRDRGAWIADLAGKIL